MVDGASIDDRSDHGLIVLSKDTVIAGGTDKAIYTSVDGGHSWTRDECSTNSPPPSGMFRIGPIQMVTDSIGYMMSYPSLSFLDSLIWRTTNRGASWTAYPIETQTPYMSMWRAYFPTPAIGFVVADGIDTSLEHQFGAVYKSIDSGKSWRRQTVPTTTQLYCVHFRTPQLGLVCGDSGVMLRTTDGGEHWRQISVSETGTFGDVRFIDDTLGYAVGASGVLETRDAGLTWKEIELRPGIPRDSMFGVYRIFCSDGGHVYFAGTNTIVTNWTVSQGPLLHVGGNEPLAEEAAVIEVIPNPVVHQIATIKVKGSVATTLFLDVCDVQGHLVARLKTSSVDMSGDRIYLWNTADVAKGVYFVGPHAGFATAAIRVE